MYVCIFIYLFIVFLHQAIATECGIYDPDHGVALEGPAFRKMTPRQLDAVLPKLQVLARSSPDDKHLLVTRLNGTALPRDRDEWEELHPELSWETDRDSALPGYWDEVRMYFFHVCVVV